MPRPDPSAQIIANKLSPSPAYAAIARLLRDTEGAEGAIKYVAQASIDALDIEVEIICEDPNPAYEAEISPKSRTNAELALRQVARTFDASTDHLHSEAIQALLSDLDRALVDVPQSWKDAAKAHDILPQWHGAFAELCALQKLVEWTTGKDVEWVEWFTGAIEPGFFSAPERIDQVLLGLDNLPRKGKIASPASQIAGAWGSALLREPEALPHINAVAVHQHLHQGRRPSLGILRQQGWVLDPTQANWRDVVSLEHNTAYGDRSWVIGIIGLLVEHIDQIATKWPEMMDKPARFPSTQPSIDQPHRDGPITLHHLLATVAAPEQKAQLNARLQACMLRRQTPRGAAKPSMAPRF